MMSDCIIENEELIFAESKTTTYVYLKKANRYIPLDDFDKCFLGENNKFVFGIVNETLKKPPLKLKDIQNSKPFNTATIHPEYKLTPPTIKLMEVPEKPPQVNLNETNDLFVGGTAVLALLIAAYSQIKQKKNQLEESKCCSKYDDLNNKINKLISDNENKEKALYVELYEHYKEVKELKEDTELLKDATNKLLDKGLSK